MIRRNWIVINMINKILIVNYIDSSSFLQLEALHGERCMEFDILASELMWFFLSFLTKEFNCEVVLPWAGNIFARFPLPCAFPRNTREADPHFPQEKRSCRATSEEQKHDSCRAITAPWSLTNSFVFIFYTWLFLRFPNYSNMFSLQLLFSKKTNIFVWFSNNYRPACDRWRVFMWHLTEGLLRSRIHDIANKLLFNILQS